MDSKRVIAITGASRGVGRGLAEHFLAKGFTVAGCSRGVSTIDSSDYHHTAVDVTDEAQVRRWARQLKNDFGRVDAVVNNVGLVQIGAVTGMTSLEMFQAFVNAILTSTFLVCREFSRHMAVQRFGRIVNITSIMTELHAPGTCAYSSAKAAVVEFTKVLATELAGSGVTCNVVSPSLVSTESSDAFGLDWKKNMLSMQTIKRPISVDELSHVVDFFVAPESSFITGQIIHTCLVN